MHMCTYAIHVCMFVFIAQNMILDVHQLWIWLKFFFVHHAQHALLPYLHNYFTHHTTTYSNSTCVHELNHITRQHTEVTYNKVFMTEGTKTFCIYQTHSPDIVSLTLWGTLAERQCLASLIEIEIERERGGGVGGTYFVERICDVIQSTEITHLTALLFL